MKKILIISFICFLSTIFTGCVESTINQYKITFNSNGGTEVSSITHDYNKQVTKPTDPTKTGYTFGGWYSDSDFTNKYTFPAMPQKNITLYASWLVFSIEGLIYTTLEDNTYSVIGYNGSDHQVIIPRIYKGCLVTKIGGNAFAGIENLTTVIFEEGSQLITIGHRAFEGAKSLRRITIPNSVITIDYLAFARTKSLTAVTFEEGSQLTTIGYNAFEGAESLTSITIPNGLTTIEQGVFMGATSLTSITIPKSVTTIKDAAFGGTTSLTNVTFEEESQLKTIGYAAFSEATSLTSITIPNSVITIEDFAFFYATSLTSITIPKSVTKIGRLAFRDTTNLTTIIFEEGSQLTTIEDQAFLGTTSLTSIIITAPTPPSVTDLGISNDNLKIYVPSDYVNIYKTEWRDYSSIIYSI